MANVLAFGPGFLQNCAFQLFCLQSIPQSTVLPLLKRKIRDFPGGPVVKNPPCNAGDTGSIPGQGTRILHTSEQLSTHN